MPYGFKVAYEPAKMDSSLVGKHPRYIYFLWDSQGQLGKFTNEMANSTPRLFRKSNDRVMWALDGSKGPSN